MADIKKFAEELVNLSVKDVQELAKVLKEEYGIEPAAAAGGSRGIYHQHHHLCAGCLGHCVHHQHQCGDLDQDHLDPAGRDPAGGRADHLVAGRTEG